MHLQVDFFVQAEGGDIGVVTDFTFAMAGLCPTEIGWKSITEGRVGTILH